MGKSGGNEGQKEEVKENGSDGGLDGENIKGRARVETKWSEERW